MPQMPAENEMKQAYLIENTRISKYFVMYAGHTALLG
jgi:hypothetical protein